MIESMRESVTYTSNCLVMCCESNTEEIEIDRIRQVFICHMEDEVNHGDETFHIVLLDDYFWLIGPFVNLALGAFDALIAAHSSLPIKNIRISSLPWKLRKKGWLGLRLFPVAGFVKLPLIDLPVYIVVEGNGDG